MYLPVFFTSLVLLLLLLYEAIELVKPLFEAILNILVKFAAEVGL